LVSWGFLGTNALASDFQTEVYGYSEAYAEKVFSEPSVNDAGETVTAHAPHEFDVPHLFLMVNSRYGNVFQSFLALKAAGAGEVGVSNAWVQGDLLGRYLSVRAGKLYRRFGLYNEVLDAVPTYIGIEPPEVFDKDHLMLTRTTNLMVHGNANLGDLYVEYALMTGNDERQGS